MKSRIHGVLFLCLICGAALVLVLHNAAPKETLHPAKPDTPNQNLVATYGKLPLAFEINKGQTNSQVKFLSRGSGYTLFLTSDGAVLALKKPSAVSGQRSALRNWKFATPNSTRGSDLRIWSSDFRLLALDNLQSSIGHSPSASSQLLAPSTLRLKLLGANSSAKVEGTGQLRGRSNYFIGNDPKKWRSNVSNYAKVHYRDVYPGVDLVYYGNQGKLEHDFVVSPGGDPTAIKLAIEGADSLQLDKQGNLVAQLISGEVILNKPTIYQPGNPKSVDGHFAILADNHVGFDVAAYDHTQPLIIDPVLVYSSVLGGSSDDFGYAVAVDRTGAAYVTGSTTSVDFPTSAGAYQTTYKGGDGGNQGIYGDVFVTKLNPAGSALVYSTYIGGSSDDAAYGIAIDAHGNAYLTGGSGSADYPVTAGAYYGPTGSNYYGNDVFITKLNPTGSSLVYSTHIGNPGQGIRGFGIAVDTTGSAYITGGAGPDFPTTPGAFQTTFGGIVTTFVTKFNPTGSGLVYSTYLSGAPWVEYGWDIAVDASGKAYVVGYTEASSFPTTPGAFQKDRRGPSDAYVAVLNAAGSGLVYSTLLGGSSYDSSNIAGTIRLDAAGNIYVSSNTESQDFPTTPAAFQKTFGGGTSDYFVAKLDPTKSGPASLVYCTLLGGMGDEGIWNFARGLAVDTAGNAFVTGATTSADFPVSRAIMSENDGHLTAFLAKLNPTGTALIYSTYLGGTTAQDLGQGIALDSTGNAYVTGMTSSFDFPLANPFLVTCESCSTGGWNGFITKVGPANVARAGFSATSVTFGEQKVGTTSQTKALTLRNVGSQPLTVTWAVVLNPSPLVFKQSNSCVGQTLDPGQACTFNLAFTPPVAAPRTGTLLIYTPKMLRIPLSGTGIKRLSVLRG